MPCSIKLLPLRPPRFIMAHLIWTSPADTNGFLNRLKYYRELDNDISETTQSAIDEAALRIPCDSDDPEFAPRLKTLVILLLRRYRKTAVRDDLQQAILRAEDMMVATPPCHPERKARIEDWVDMILVKVCREGVREVDLEYVVEMAQQVGVTVKIKGDPNEYGFATHASKSPSTLASLAVPIRDRLLI